MQTPDPRSSSPDVRAAVSRARWSVLQTGLITSGLALFGVYVLANRISEAPVLGMYVFRWIPAGVLLVGTIAGSGYLLAAWWFGVAVTCRTLLVIFLFQLCTYFAAQYAEFQTLNLVHRITREPVRFPEYFQYTTKNWTPAPADALSHERPLGNWGYALRGAEAFLFCLCGAGAALALTGKPRCVICRGQLHSRRIGVISCVDAAKTIAKLQELACAGNLASFRKVINAARLNGAAQLTAGEASLGVELELVRCAVCGCGHLTTIEPQAAGGTSCQASSSRTELDARFAAELSAFDGAPARA